MSRVLIAVAIVAAVVFTLFPEIDLWMSGLFYRPDGGFYLKDAWWAVAIYDSIPIIVIAVGVGSLLFLIGNLARKRQVGPLSNRFLGARPSTRCNRILRREAVYSGLTTDGSVWAELLVRGRSPIGRLLARRFGIRRSRAKATKPDLRSCGCAWPGSRVRTDRPGRALPERRNLLGASRVRRGMGAGDPRLQAGRRTGRDRGRQWNVATLALWSEPYASSTTL